MQTSLLAAVFLLVPTLAVAAERQGKQRVSPRTTSGLRAFDVRDRERPAARSRGLRVAQARLRGRLGRNGLLEIDPSTGTPGRVAKLSDFLTGRRSGRARDVALGYLRENRSAFGLDSGDLSSLRISREYRSGRLAHVDLRQSYRGIPAYDSGLKANVVEGRLLNVSGAPAPDLSVRSTKPRLRADQAVDKLAGRRGRSEGRPKLAIFAAPAGNRLVWELIAQSDADHTWHAAVDAASGEVLQRSNITKHASGRAVEYRPGINRDGVAGVDDGGSYDLEAFGANWIDATADRLRGSYAYTYADPNDTLGAQPLATSGVQADPTSGGGDPNNATWDYPTVTGPAGTPADRTCPYANGCTWNGYLASGATDGVFTASGTNWQRNRNANATQVHWFVNRFHDHLRDATGIGFNAASGNFEGSDLVHAQTDDGANTGTGSDDGFPNTQHVNNANMTTRPDGTSPTMQMYLFSGAYGGNEHDVNGGDDAAVVYHEYTHGLSGRLVTTSSGVVALDGAQAGAMGEAWSDWYMFDFLNSERLSPTAPPLQPDGAADGDLVQGDYESPTFTTEFVSEATDCRVDVVSTNCPRGGYTYADFGRISGFGPEVHFDGEIWTQTLWQLRTRLVAKYGETSGIARARQLITGGMRISSAEPDFLDMRDSIYQTDVADPSKDDLQLMREVFAARGMGACAASDGPNDTMPRPDFRANAPAGGCSGTSTPTPVLPSAPTTSTTPLKLLSDIGFGGFPRRASLRRVLGRGLAGRISCDVGCAFRASLVLPRRSARRAGFRGRTVVVSRTQGSIGASGTSRKVRFKFKRRVARRLRRLTRGTGLEVRVSAADSRGTDRTEKKQLRLKR